jgi:hypothetical protein
LVDQYPESEGDAHLSGELQNPEVNEELLDPVEEIPVHVEENLSEDDIPEEDEIEGAEQQGQVEDRPQSATDAPAPQADDEPVAAARRSSTQRRKPTWLASGEYVQMQQTKSDWSDKAKFLHTLLEEEHCQGLEKSEILKALLNVVRNT